MQANSTHMSCTALPNFDGNDFEVLLRRGFEADQRLARNMEDRSAAAAADPEPVSGLGEVDDRVEVLHARIRPQSERALEPARDDERQRRADATARERRG